jgi:predicted dehydrogenase
MFLDITQFLDIAEWLNGPIIDCEADANALRASLHTNTRTVAHLTHENGARSMLTYEEFGQQTCEHVTVHSSASTYIVRGSMMQPNELLVWASDGHQIFPAPVNPLERGGFLDQAKSFLRHVQKNSLVHPDGAQLARIIHLAREIDGSAWWNEARVGMFN